MSTKNKLYYLLLPCVILVLGVIIFMCIRIAIPDNSSLVHEDKITVRLGMQKSEVAKTLQNDGVLTNLPSNSNPDYPIKQFQYDNLYVTYRNNKVCELKAKGNDWKTAKGITVDNEYSDIWRAYYNLKIDENTNINNYIREYPVNSIKFSGRGMTKDESSWTYKIDFLLNDGILRISDRKWSLEVN